jgi:hypothetical protein
VSRLFLSRILSQDTLRQGQEIGRHAGQPVGRYGFFLGGAFGSDTLAGEVKNAVRALREERDVVSQRRLVERRVIGILEKSEAEPLKRTKWPKSVTTASGSTAAATAQPMLTPRTEARAMFKVLDTDGDGRLSSSEMSSRLSDFGVADEQIELLFFRMDLDGDGFIDMEEWEECWKAGLYQQAVGLQWVAPKDKQLVEKKTGKVIKAGALGNCGVCGQQIEGGTVIGPIEGKYYHKECWLGELASKCEGCGEAIDGKCITITSKGGEAVEQTKWHQKCWEKEKKRRARQPKGGFPMVAGTRSGKKGKKLSASMPAMPFAHMFAFDGMGGAAMPRPPTKPKKLKGKKKGKAVKKGQGGDDAESGADEDLLRAFDLYAARQLDFGKAVEELEDLIDVFKAIEGQGPEPESKRDVALDRSLLGRTGK